MLIVVVVVVGLVDKGVKKRCKNNLVPPPAELSSPSLIYQLLVIGGMEAVGISHYVLNMWTVQIPAKIYSPFWYTAPLQYISK